jgi:hypothetical protein
MKTDRLHRDQDDIYTLGDLVNARSEHTSHFPDDVDALGCDIDLPDDLDVDEALTFPHPKPKKPANIDLMDTPHFEDADGDWDPRDLPPTDYEHAYNEGTDAHLTDDPDETGEELVHSMSHPDLEDAAGGSETEIMPGKFTPDEDTFI